MMSYPAPRPQIAGERETGYKLLSLFLGLVVTAMGFFGLWLALSAQHARDDANRAADVAQSTPSASAAMPGMKTSSVRGGTYASPSFAARRSTFASASS